MIARLLQVLWCATLVAIAALAWFLVDRFGAIVGPWVAILGAIMLVGALHPAAVACNFIASRILGDPVPEACRLSLWQAIRTYDDEIDASLRGVWFANPFLEGRPAPVPVVASRRVALLFIHGYFCNRAVWHSFMRDAASRGYRCEAITLADPMASIDSHDADVASAIAALVGTSGERVVIVGHSMGGLVARAALQRIDATRVAHVFTLGTPHHGTATAHFGRQPSVVEMRRGSAWLAGLAPIDPSGPSWTAIFSHHDDIVYPQTSGRLAGAECVAIGGCGHVSLLYDRRVRALVFERLEAQAGS